ncbi:hypothetical protein [Amycolatopsis sp. cmx-11-12]|uniref:hypothetical protein n=1 Tax=Amycolatopsis sp. cmx-11-12 TaxID=2785795 RepID=UPI003917BB0C
MITLVEFLNPISRSSYQAKCLATLYYHERYKNSSPITTEEMRTALAQARISVAKKMNIPDILNKAGHYVDTDGVDNKGRKLWHLTEAGRTLVRSMLNLPDHEPEIEIDVGTLRRIAEKVNDDVVKSYIEEALICLSVGAFRAAIVFLWSGAVRTLQDSILAHGATAVNAAIQKHDTRVRSVAKIEDFSSVKDMLTLLAARELGIIDKGQWSALDAALTTRNQCGHPTSYRPGEKKTSGIIEDIVNILYQGS